MPPWSTTPKSIARWVAFSGRRRVRQKSRRVRERPGAMRQGIARKAGVGLANPQESAEVTSRYAEANHVKVVAAPTARCALPLAWFVDVHAQKRTHPEICYPTSRAPPALELTSSPRKTRDHDCAGWLKFDYHEHLVASCNAQRLKQKRTPVSCSEMSQRRRAAAGSRAAALHDTSIGWPRNSPRPSGPM